MKNRTLIVILNDENPRLLKRYNKRPEKQDAIRAMITQSNKIFKEAFTFYWRASKDVIYITNKELASLPAGGYVLFRFTPDEAVYDINFSQNDFSIKKNLIKNRTYGKMEFYLFENKSKDPFLTFFTPTAYPFEEDIYTSVAQINHFLLQKYNDPSFNMKDYEELVEEWNYKIKEKILLVDTATIEKLQGSYNYIKEEYPFPYELTSGEKIKEKIKCKDTNYVFAVIFPHRDMISRGRSYEGTYGGGMDDFTNETYYTHLILETHTFFILGMVKNMDSMVNRRSWKQYYKLLDSDSFNPKNLMER